MRLQRNSTRSCPYLLFALLFLVSLANGQEQMIFPFGAMPIGASPFGSPVIDTQGNLYVTTAGTGGTSNTSYVFLLGPPPAKGAEWGSQIIGFINGSMNAGLAIDKHDKLYGTASGGTKGGGYAFELIPTDRCCDYGQNVIYNFTGEFNGSASAMVLDANRNLFGAYYGYDNYSCGFIFELQPPSSGHALWSETTLYTFTGSTDGCSPTGVVLDTLGNVYGQTLSAGANKEGTIFELTPPSASGGSWTEQTIYAFPVGGISADIKKAFAAKPAKKTNVPAGYEGFDENTLAIDANGNLYGTSPIAGTSGNGYVFELSPPAASGNPWTFSTLYSFGGTPDGSFPAGGLAIDSTGALYGTTYLGGPITQWSGGGYGIGTVFKLSPPNTSGGAWTEKILHNFTAGYDGWFPATSPILGPKGVIYGTTTVGGINNTLCTIGSYYATGCGTVFQITP